MKSIIKDIQACLLLKILYLQILLLLFGTAQNAFTDNPNSSCGNTVVGGKDAPNDCYTVTPLPGMITVDGRLTGTEWDDVPAKDLTGDFAAKIRFKRNGNNLHFLISVNDAVKKEDDRIELYFDPLHNHTSTADDIIFRINRINADHRRISNNGNTNVVWSPGTNLDIEDFSDGGSPPDFVTGWAAEVTITDAASDLCTSGLSAILGFTVFVVDQNTGNQTSWPDPFPASAAAWANLKTRYPIEYMFMFEYSWSMLGPNRMYLYYIGKAVAIMANTMAIFSDPSYFEDKIGEGFFAWYEHEYNHFPIRVEIDLTRVLIPLSDISSFLDASMAPEFTSSTTIIGVKTDSPLQHLQTPLGRGLDTAFAALGTDVEETQREVFLLSDGLHNRPRDEVPLLPRYLNYDPCPEEGRDNWNVCPEGTEHQVHVNTFALGKDPYINTDLLTDIKNRYDGSFNLTEDEPLNPEDMVKCLLHYLEELYHTNLVFSGSSYSEFIINKGERRLVTIVSWTNPEDAVDIHLQQKANPADPWKNLTCDNFVKDNTWVGFAICAVSNPAEGTYRVVDINGNPLTSDSYLFVLVGSNLRAIFASDKKIHGTGEEIILTADLKEAGLPVTNEPINKHLVKVQVNVRRPGESIGTYISVRTLDSCEPQPPELPSIERKSDLIHGPYSDSTYRNIVLQPSDTIDTKPARFSKIDSLFKLCDKDSLIYTEESEIELYDDGKHGDVTPNDGIYTLKFANTPYEGNYLFRFNASGISPSGSEFSRVKTIAEYVQVEVDPVTTKFKSREYQRCGNIVVREFYVIPCDRLHNYLGPGFTDQIQFKTTAGGFIGSVIDYNNGIYSQLLRYDESKDRPVVTPIVQGKTLRPIRVFKPFELVLPFTGRFFFDDSLGLEDCTVVGARLGYRFTNQLTFELEGGVTFTETVAGNSGNVIQALANLCYDIYPLRIGQWIPYVTGGGGYFFFRGFGVDDEAFAYHGGLGSTFKFKNWIGARVDGRYIFMNDVMGVGKTTNVQVTGGIVFWF